MKTLIMVSLFAIATTTHAQPKAGLAIGENSKGFSYWELTTAYQIKFLTIYPASFKIPFKASNVSQPKIIESKIGAHLLGFEVFGGYGYHFTGNEVNHQYDSYKGFKPCYGISKNIGRIFKISSGMEGKIWISQFGIFGGR